MKIILERTRGNLLWTEGLLTVEGYGFKCRTLELRNFNHSDAINKRIRHSIPMGTYPCRVSYTPIMDFTPQTGLINGSNRAVFVSADDYTSLRAGQIALGSHVDGNGKITWVREIFMMLDNIIEKELRMEGMHNFRLTLEVKESIDYAEVPYSEPANYLPNIDFVSDN